MMFTRNINVTMIILNNYRNWSVSVRSATHKHPPKIITDEKEKEKILWQVHSCWPQWCQCHCRKNYPAILLERGQG